MNLSSWLPVEKDLLAAFVDAEGEQKIQNLVDINTSENFGAVNETVEKDNNDMLDGVGLRLHFYLLVQLLAGIDTRHCVLDGQGHCRQTQNCSLQTRKKGLG